MKKRPQQEEGEQNTPVRNSVKMTLDFTTPEPPPFVTIRKKKPPKPLESLQGTVIGKIWPLIFSGLKNARTKMTTYLHISYLHILFTMHASH